MTDKYVEKNLWLVGWCPSDPETQTMGIRFAWGLDLGWDRGWLEGPQSNVIHPELLDFHFFNSCDSSDVFSTGTLRTWTQPPTEAPQHNIISPTGLLPSLGFPS